MKIFNGLLKKERQSYILHQLNLHNKVVNTDLCALMQVSEDTIRRDLQELSDMGKLIKVHGGALSTAFNEVQFTNGRVYSQPYKKRIAEKAIRLIQNGMFVLTGGGTTVMEMARSLPPQLRATFVTGSIAAMNIYGANTNLDTIAVGGKISKDSKITIGSDAIAKIKEIHADLCFLGTNAIDIKYGVTDNDWEVVQLKKAMIGAARQTVFMTISEKLNSSQPIKVCDVNQINYLITELDPDNVLLKSYVEAGITVL